MSLKKYSHEEISKMSMIEIANVILLDKKKAMDFRDIFKKIAELKGFSEEEKATNITQFYTDLNIDGRFMTTGSNLWGLKTWYPVDQRDEEITTPAPKKKKKKATKKKKPAKKKDVFEEEEDEEELDIVDDDIEEMADDLDDDDDFDDDDFDDDDFDDDDDEDEDDDDEEEDEGKK